jgi:hypothetical protein
MTTPADFVVKRLIEQGDVSAAGCIPSRQQAHSYVIARERAIKSAANQMASMR